MNPVISVLCTIGAVVAYVLIVFFITFAYFKALAIDNPDDDEIMMMTCIVQFIIAMIVIAIYFSKLIVEDVR